MNHRNSLRELHIHITAVPDTKQNTREFFWDSREGKLVENIEKLIFRPRFSEHWVFVIVQTLIGFRSSHRPAVGLRGTAPAAAASVYFHKFH